VRVLLCSRMWLSVAPSPQPCKVCRRSRAGTRGSLNLIYLRGMRGVCYCLTLAAPSTPISARCAALLGAPPGSRHVHLV
jgi:hypothetical protein